MQTNRKQAVRDYMQQRQTQRTPPQSIEEIRRQLGWNLIPGAKQTQDR